MNQKDNNLEILSPTNVIALYTFLCILLNLRQQLGLEAMLEYLDKYSRLLENSNPKMKQAVKQALELIDVNKIYTELINKNE